MKRIITLILAAVFALALLTGCSAKVSDAAVYDTVQQKDGNLVAATTITVTGYGKMTVKPDMATVSVGVRTDEATAELASSKNAEIVEKVLTAVKKMGINDDDITTENYSIYPNYVYNQADGTESVNGYQANTMLSVKCYDIENVGSVIDTAVAAGANQTYGVYFSIKDKSIYDKDLAKLAAEDALRQAEAYAEALGMKVKKVVSATTGAQINDPVIYVNADEAVAEEKDAVTTSGTSIQQGTLDVSANIIIKYIIE